MEDRHLLGTRLSAGVGSTLYQQLKESSLVERGLVDRVVLVVTLVDLVGSGTIVVNWVWLCG